MTFRGLKKQVGSKLVDKYWKHMFFFFQYVYMSVSGLKSNIYLDQSHGCWLYWPWRGTIVISESWVSNQLQIMRIWHLSAAKTIIGRIKIGIRKVWVYQIENLFKYAQMISFLLDYTRTTILSHCPACNLKGVSTSNYRNFLYRILTLDLIRLKGRRPMIVNLRVYTILRKLLSNYLRT